MKWKVVDSYECIHNYVDTSPETMEIFQAPFAYRSMEEIVEVICDTVQIEKVIRPIYNYKAGGN